MATYNSLSDVFSAPVNSSRNTLNAERREMIYWLEKIHTELNDVNSIKRELRGLVLVIKDRQ